MMHHFLNSLKFYKILLWMAINCNASLGKTLCLRGAGSFDKLRVSE